MTLCPANASAVEVVSKEYARERMNEPGLEFSIQKAVNEHDIGLPALKLTP
jgi:hypothetical protein